MSVDVPKNILTGTNILVNVTRGREMSQRALGGEFVYDAVCNTERDYITLTGRMLDAG
jgi:hypothetical protein